MPDDLALTPDTLIRRIGTADAPLLLDVSTDADFDADPFLVPGALRVPHRDLLSAPGIGSGRDMVVICQKGLKLSMGGAAMLRAAGHPAKALAGGNLGWHAAGLPRIPAEAAQTMRWVLDPEGGTDSLAVAWILRRLVAPGATLLWVPGAIGADVADRFDAALAPSRPDALLEALALDWPPLLRFSVTLATDPLLAMLDRAARQDASTHEAWFDLMRPVCDLVFLSASQELGR
jgi:rhodanese-related sulfurtransferase